MNRASMTYRIISGSLTCMQMQSQKERTEGDKIKNI